MMPKLFLFLLITVHFGLARAEEGAVGACPQCSNSERHQKAPEIDFWSVTEKDVNEAHCLNLKPPTEAEMTDYLKTVIATNSSPTEDRVINGISFQNEPKEFLDLFQNLHYVNPSEAGAPADLQFHPHCHEVICAMNEIYGSPQGLQIFYLYARYGYAATTYTHKADANTPWSSGELNELISDLQTLPPDFFPMKKMGRTLLHSTIDTREGCNGRDVSNAAIQILPPWFCLPQQKRLSTFTHEIGHDVTEERGDLDTQPEWIKATGWNIVGVNNDGGVRTSAKSKNSPSIYGGQDIHEDFAETFASYRLSPEHLKAISPERYQYMKDHVFHGVEFTSEDCEKEFEKEQTRLSEIKDQHRILRERAVAEESNDRKIVKQLSMSSHLIVPANNLPSILGTCLNQYLQESLDQKQGAADSCLKNNIRRKLFVAAGGNPETPQSAISSIPVTDIQKNEVRNFAKRVLSQALYDSYKNDDVISSSRTAKQCDDNAESFYRNMPDENLRTASQPALMKQLIARACRLRIQAFGTKLIGQYNNPFAKNTFEQVFSF